MVLLRPLLVMAFWFLSLATALMVVRSLSQQAESRFRHSVRPAILLWAPVAAMSLLQIPFPVVYRALHRDATLIAAGQLWRLVTSPLVQGGAVMGAVPNLVGLAFLSLVAMAYWGVARTWLVFWGGALASNVAVLGIHPVGGGNSMANFALATALTSSVLADPRRRRSAWGFALVVLLCVAVFAVWRDYHVWSCLIGLVLGLLPARRCQPCGPPPLSRRALATGPGHSPSPWRKHTQDSAVTRGTYRAPLTLSAVDSTSRSTCGGHHLEHGEADNQEPRRSHLGGPASTHERQPQR